MQRPVVIALTALFVLTLLAYSMTYSVRFTETAVVTTFGKATESDVRGEPGLKFKLPYPIQDVTKYDTRIRFVQLRKETQQTADARQIVIESFCTWHVSNPLKFFQKFSASGQRAEEHYRKAEDTIQSNLRSAVGLASRYRLDELFSVTIDRSKIPELEQEILAALSQASAAGVSLADYGIAVDDVGVSSIVLPEATTTAVFERMKADRKALVTAIESRGNAEAEAITTNAEITAQRIRAFADELAKRIRATGDAEAAQYVEQMNKHPELAAFLRIMELWRDSTARVTLVLPTDQPGVGALRPDAANELSEGEFPGMEGMDRLMKGDLGTIAPAKQGGDQ